MSKAPGRLSGVIGSLPCILRKVGFGTNGLPKAVRSWLVTTTTYPVVRCRVEAVNGFVGCSINLVGLIGDVVTEISVLSNSLTIVTGACVSGSTIASKILTFDPREMLSGAIGWLNRMFIGPVVEKPSLALVYR